MTIPLETFRQPAVVATDVCIDLALGLPDAIRFFQEPPVDIRLATATYLELLQSARSPEEQRRIKRFVQGYAVLSLGPMASSMAVQLLLDHSLTAGLTPLQALVAATALAHGIPLVTQETETFGVIEGLQLILPFGVG